MATKAEEPGITPSEPHTSTPTLAEPGSEDRPHVVDVEKQASAPPGIPGAPFPDGGLRGWATVLGAWLAGMSFLPHILHVIMMVPVLTSSQSSRPLDTQTRSERIKDTTNSKATLLSRHPTYPGLDQSSSSSNSRSGQYREPCTTKDTFTIWSSLAVSST